MSEITVKIRFESWRDSAISLKFLVLPRIGEKINIPNERLQGLVHYYVHQVTHEFHEGIAQPVLDVGYERRK
jgi:hypothetical protein